MIVQQRAASNNKLFPEREKEKKEYSLHVRNERRATTNKRKDRVLSFTVSTLQTGPRLTLFCRRNLSSPQLLLLTLTVFHFYFLLFPFTTLSFYFIHYNLLPQISQKIKYFSYTFFFDENISNCLIVYFPQPPLIITLSTRYCTHH